MKDWQEIRKEMKDKYGLSFEYTQRDSYCHECWKPLKGGHSYWTGGSSVNPVRFCCRTHAIEWAKRMKEMEE